MHPSAMSTRTEHAHLADLLSAALAEMEVGSTPVAVDVARHAIREAWLAVVDGTERGRANVSSSYLANVHRQLVSAAGISASDGFQEYGLPILPDGGRQSWTRFVNEAGYAKPGDDCE